MYRKHIFVDLETTNTNTPEPYLTGFKSTFGWMYEGLIIGDHKVLIDISFINWFNELLKLKNNVMIWAINGSGFDFHFLIKLILKVGLILDKQNKKTPYSFRIFMDGHKRIKELAITLPTFKNVKKNGKYVKKYYEIIFRDIMLMFNGSLNSYAENMNRDGYSDIKKLNGEINYKQDFLFENNDDVPQNEIKYLANDVEVLFQAFHYFQTKIPLNEWKITSSSYTYEKWIEYIGEDLITISDKKRKDINGFKYIENKKTTINMTKRKLVNSLLDYSWIDEGNFLKLEPFYTGGLSFVNPIYKGIKFSPNDLNKKVGVDDVNSSYSGSMYNNSFPYGKPWEVFSDEEKLKYDYKDFNLKLYKITISKPYINEEGLPFIYQTRSRTKKDFGEIKNNEGGSYRVYEKKLNIGVYYLTDVEYKQFLIYYSGGKHTKEIVYSFRSITGEFLFGKFILNAYYNKNKFKNFSTLLTYIYKLHLNSLYGKFGEKPHRESIYLDTENGEFYKEENFKINKYFPIACFITAYARLTLVNYVGKQYKYVVGGDTDSIFTTEDFIKNPKLLSNDKLGLWKNEGVYSHFIFRRSKQYFGFNILENGEWEIKDAFAGMRFNRDKQFLNRRNLDTYVKGDLINNQLQSVKFIGGVKLTNTQKQLNPVWDYPPNNDDWFKSKEEYYANYEKQINYLQNL